MLSRLAGNKTHGPLDEKLSPLQYRTYRSNLMVAAKPIETAALSGHSRGQLFPLLKDILEDVNSKIKTEYSHITRRPFPTDWMEGNETNNVFFKLQVDSSFEEAKRDLGLRLMQLSPLPDCSNDLDVTVQIISKKLSILLHAVAMIAEITLNESKKLRSYNETEWRAAWDMFFLNFAVTAPGECTGINIL